MLISILTFLCLVFSFPENALQKEQECMDEGKLVIFIKNLGFCFLCSSSNVLKFKVAEISNALSSTYSLIHCNV